MAYGVVYVEDRGQGRRRAYTPTWARELYDKASNAIDALFSNTTVPASKTRDLLEELQAEIEIKIDSLEGNTED